MRRYLLPDPVHLPAYPGWICLRVAESCSLSDWEADPSPTTPTEAAAGRSRLELITRHYSHRWDDLTVTNEYSGAMVVVWRETAQEKQFLLLHAVEAKGDEDWAWRSPSGCAEAGETPEACGARELYEETGLCLDLVSVSTDGRWPVFVARAPGDAAVVLSHEHDGMRWATADEALALVKPDVVTTGLRAAMAHCK